MRISDWSSDVCSSDLEIAVMAGKLVGWHPRTAQDGTRSGPQGPPVAGRPRARLRDPQLVPGGRRQYAEARLAMLHQRYRNRPAWPPAQIVPRAVDGIDHPDAGQVQPVHGVGRLLRQPSARRTDGIRSDARRAGKESV